MSILLKMIGFVKPLTGSMIVAILFGTMGHLLAISIPVVGILAVLSALGFYAFSLETLFTILLINSVLRGVFAYIEQQRNHYIAFTILAIIRDKIFTVLRKLCPAKLDGKERGNLISIITSDIELLEVFYAHTISPIAIAILVSIIISCIMYTFNPIFAVVSLTAHFTVGCVLPILMSKNNTKVYSNYRNQNGELSSYYLDSLRGLDEVIQFDNGEKRIEEIIRKTKNLENESKKISTHEGTVNAFADFLVLGFSLTVLLIGTNLYTDVSQVFMPTVIMLSSFGPVLSLSKLSVGLSRTLASAKRVQDLIEEVPEVFDNLEGETPEFENITAENLNFSYGAEDILKNIDLEIEKNKITSIIGKSGSGKSTFLKLVMRFWNSEGIKISDVDVKNINTKHLRSMQSYMTQDTDIFGSTIMENIRVGNLSATDDEVIDASKQASLHEFVETLPDGYNTKVAELGDTLSGGERQRIGLARAFLHKAPLLLLDEPTSNLDSLNESIILKSLKESDRTVVIISHRKSTLSVSDKSYMIENGVIKN